MRITLKTIPLILLLFTGTITSAQVVNVNLFSKMDVSPQYTLWDGSNTMLMGYTELLGEAIDLPSPLIIVNEGDSVDLSLTNFSQPAPHTIHLHGLDVNQQNDGVPHLSFQIPHDSTGHYYFVAPHAGTYLYHCHVLSTLHVQAGMYGMLIVRPTNGSNTTWNGGYTFDSEHAWLFSEIDTNWHTFSVINDPWDPQSNSQLLLDYAPQYFLVNGLSEQQLYSNEASVNASVGEVVYMRLANIGYYGNRVIFPEHVNAKIISSDGRPLPSEVVTDTVSIMPGERYGVLVEPTIETNSFINIDYFNLNTQQTANTQKVPLNVDGFIGYIVTEKNQMLIYPNPTNDYFNVILPETLKEVEIVVTNMLGQIVYSTKIQLLDTDRYTLETLDWDEGIYLIQFDSQNGQLTEKIIIKK